MLAIQSSTKSILTRQHAFVLHERSIADKSSRAIALRYPVNPEASCSKDGYAFSCIHQVTILYVFKHPDEGIDRLVSDQMRDILYL